jgi:hypothetical protein
MKESTGRNHRSRRCDHLRFEIIVHGQSVDPLEWLDAKWIEEKIMSKIGR